MDMGIGAAIKFSEATHEVRAALQRILEQLASLEAVVDLKRSHNAAAGANSSTANAVANGAPGVPAWPPPYWTLRLRSGQAREAPVAPPYDSSSRNGNRPNLDQRRIAYIVRGFDNPCFSMFAVGMPVR